MQSQLSAYLEMTKTRITSLVAVTTALGYYLGSGGEIQWGEFLFLLIGAAMVCSGSGVLNHYLEREVDCKMTRTRNRPIPMGVISPANALNFGILLILVGEIILYTQTNLLTAFLSLLTAFLYVLVYTPMKRISWLNTSIGAIPGAIPPMGGWAAATNSLDAGAWVLFAILFIWQHPHFFAIAWMCREDYGRGGFKMLPVIDPDGKSTFHQILIFSVLLIPVSLLPTVIGLSGLVYGIGALIAGVALLLIGNVLARSKSTRDARGLLQATVIYLPVLLMLIILDGTF